ncbi:MAG: alpha/beta hydrolase [Saprospiraceae bacterium]|nr:alpha/beta hydrolase [Saprospiraceae bacterium]
MKLVISKDGTQIAYEKSGIGKPLIIVGGSLADHQMYVPLATELAQKLTVFNYDRRNRGESSNSTNHTIETELQDLEAIVSLCDEAPILYGHSAGSALAIRAVAKGLKISKLIISDIPFTPNSENDKQEAAKFAIEHKRIIELLNQNDRIGAVKFFLKDFGMSDKELDEFIVSESGKQAVANSITLPVDYAMLDNGLTPVELLKKIKVPTLIITSHYGLTTAEDVASHLSDCKLAVLENPTYGLSANEIAKPIFNFLKLN